MSEVLRPLQRIRDSFLSIPSGVRLALVLIVIVVASGGIYYAASNYAKNNSYEPLFSNLDARDASEIATKLTSQKIPFKLADNGRTILVQSSVVLSTRLALAGDGLPTRGVVGFELMDKLSLGATDFDRRVNYLRALTGELTRTIREIDGVEDARVHIVMPENSYFVSKAKPATAAVFLKLRSGAELQKAQVKGIVNLVARSVEGLKAEDVAVVDLYGRLLTGDASGSAGFDGAISNNLDTQQSFQKLLEANLQVLLERVLGPGNVVTRVTAELSFDQKTIDKTLFQPVTDGILRSIQELEETYRGQGNAPSGVPGTSSNIPQYQSAGQTGSSDFQKRESTKNYEISEIKERTVVAPGSVRRLSVAVVVNKELDDTQRAAIEKMVGAAIGLDAERKDQVTVSGMTFNTTMYDQIKKQMEDEKKTVSQTNQGLSKYILAGGGGLVVLTLLIVLLKGRGKRRPKAMERMPYEIPMSDRPKADVAEALAQAAQAAALEEALKPPTPDPEQEKRRRLREEIERVARQNPENVAQLIRTWLAEERR